MQTISGKLLGVASRGPRARGDVDKSYVGVLALLMGYSIELVDFCGYLVSVAARGVGRLPPVGNAKHKNPASPPARVGNGGGQQRPKFGAILAARLSSSRCGQ